MSNLNFSFLDGIIVVAYLTLCVVVGVKHIRVISVKDYILSSSHRMGIVPLITTIFATDVGAEVIIGQVEMVYNKGMLYAATRVFAPVFWILTALIFGRNIHRFKGCLSISDIMERLYGRPGRFVMNCIAALPPIGVISLQFASLMYLFKFFIGESYIMWFILTVTVLLFYSSMGGVKAVVFTDVIQFLTFFVAIPYTCAYSLWDIGGYEALAAKLPAEHLKLDLTGENGIFFATLVFYTLIPLADGASIQRYLMASNQRDLTKVLFGCAGASLLLTAVIMLMGFTIKAKVPDINGNEALYYLMHHYLPSGLKGLMITGMLAVVMSTADSWLNNASALYAHDIAKRIWPNLSETQELYLARICTFAIGIIATIIAMQTTSLMKAIWFISNFWSPVTLVPLLTGFLGFRSNQRSFIVATIAGITMTFVGAYIDDMQFATFSFTSGVMSNAIAMFVMHFWQKIFNPEALRGLNDVQQGQVYAKPAAKVSG